MSEATKKFERLPRCLQPMHYKLELYPNAISFVFRGKLCIGMVVKEPTSTIVLNAKRIKIKSAFVVYSGEKMQVKNESIVYDEEQEKVTLNLDKPVEKGDIELDMEYEGVLSDDMAGFYRSTYKDENGHDKVILSTQFEATYARRAFPCFDEPDRKAKFRISIVISDHLTALSCMPEESRVSLDATDPVLTHFEMPPLQSPRHYVRVTFAETPLMSTYIVAFATGAFVHLETHDSNGVLIRVHTKPGSKHLGAHALRMAASALPYLARLYGEPYPLPKLDLVAIPDFAMAAMENWGLLTYREASLLVDEKETSLASKRNVAVTVAHECAHMWFGNLVTMAWWTDLWLNEGFATYVSYLAVDNCFPEYDIWTYFVVDEVLHAMALDELPSTHSIEVEVDSPDEVDEIFDDVSYKKGASILRMLSDFMGAECFQKGLQLYIKRHKYGNTTTADLWAALNEGWQGNVAEFMAAWTRKPGFPVVEVLCGGSLDDYVDHPDRAVEFIFRPQPFNFEFLTPRSTSEDPKSEWFIPLTMCEVDDSSKVFSREWVPPSDQMSGAYRVEVSPMRPIRINPGAVGFYRVLYDETLMSHILKVLEKNRLDHTDRLSLLSDAFSLARAECKGMGNALRLTGTLRHEGNCTVWYEMVTRLREVRAVLEDAAAKDAVTSSRSQRATAALKNFDQFLRILAKEPFSKLGWAPMGEAENNNDQLLRPLLLSTLGGAGRPDVVEEAQALFQRHYDAEMAGSTSDLHPDLRGPVYAICAKYGSLATYNKLLELMERAKLQEEKVRILCSLGRSPDPAVHDRIVRELAFSGQVRKQDRARLLVNMAISSYAGRRRVWETLRDRLPTVVDDMGGAYLLGVVLKMTLAGFGCAYNWEEEVAAMKTSLPACARALQHGYNLAAINKNVCEYCFSDICNFLEEFVDGQQSSC